MPDFSLAYALLARVAMRIVPYPLAWNVVQTVSSSVTAFIPDMSTWSASHFLLVLYMQLVASHEMDKESLGRWHILVAPGF